jgi:uncharacterized membrane protein YfcA
MDLLAVLAGFGVGAIVGITGVGGGSLMTPQLMDVFKLSPALAIGTDLWFAAVTKSGAGWAHWRLGHVDWTLLVSLLVGSLPGIWLGAHLTRAMPERLVRGVRCASLVGAGIKVLN